VREELWRPIFGYEGLYEVSNLGKVKSVSERWKNSRLLTANLSGRGYLYVTLCKNRVYKRWHVAALVLGAFIGPRPIDHQVCHRDGKRTNNYIGNLRWGTPTSNQLDKWTHGTMPFGSRHHNSKLTLEHVCNIRKLAASGSSRRHLAHLFSVSVPTIKDAIRGRTWRHVTFPPPMEAKSKP